MQHTDAILSVLRELGFTVMIATEHLLWIQVMLLCSSDDVIVGGNRVSEVIQYLWLLWINFSVARQAVHNACLKPNTTNQAGRQAWHV